MPNDAAALIMPWSLFLYSHALPSVVMSYKKISLWCRVVSCAPNRRSRKGGIDNHHHQQRYQREGRDETTQTKGIRAVGQQALFRKSFTVDPRLRAISLWPTNAASKKASKGARAQWRPPSCEFSLEMAEGADETEDVNPQPSI